MTFVCDEFTPPISEIPNPPSAPVDQIQRCSETERAFAWLRVQCPLNPDLEKHLVGYAKLTGMN